MYRKPSIYVIGTLAFIAASSFLTGCSTDTTHEIKQYSIEQFLNTVSVYGSSFSHDESQILFSSNATGVYNAYSIPVSGGIPTQLTHSDSNAVFVISYFPHDNRVLFTSDKGGNEIYHLYVLQEDGTITDITPGEEIRSTFAGWNHSLESFFYENNKRDPRFMDLYEMDLESMTPTLLYKNETGYSLGDLSNDKRYLAFVKTRTTHNSDIYLYDRHNQKMKHLTPHEGEISFQPVTFSVDSKSLYFLTDEDSEFAYLKQFDIESGNSEIIEKTDWDIMYSYFSFNGRYRVTGINNDARTEIRIFDTGTNALVTPPSLPDADITSVGFSRSEKYMTFYLSSSRSPRNLYVYDLESGEQQKLTEAMNPEIDIADLVDAEVVRFKSFDGLEIPGILYKPHLKPGEKAPALVSVHGGPGGQSRIGYRSSLQYLANHGYVVLDINNRGSSGYGKTFYKLDDLQHGKGDLDDCVEAKKFFASTGYVDTSRVGIIGGSYGGYMVLAAMAFRPDAFAAGIDMFGISNWLRTLQSMPSWWEEFREALYKELGNPETDEEYLKSISPLFHADQITRPLMVLQGANDPRVIQVESDDIVAAVEKNDVPVEYIVFDDEGHGFLKKENRIRGWQAILNFLDKHLKGITPVS